LFVLGRFDEIKDTCRQAAARGTDSPLCHEYLFHVAVLEGNDGEMRRQLEWAHAQPNPVAEWNWRRKVAEFQGRIGQADELARRGMEANARQHAKSPGILWAVALDYAVAGQCQRAAEYSRAALQLTHSREILIGVGLASALCRDAGRTLAAADELERRNPGAGPFAWYAPCLRGMVKTPAEGEPSEVILQLSNWTPFDLAYCRGQVLLGQRRGAEAAEQFQVIVDHRAWGPLSVLYPPAYLGLARAAALAGDIARSRQAYQNFFAAWKDADPDLPVLLESRREYERLPTPH
jgi:hypothetical protein